MCGLGDTIYEQGLEQGRIEAQIRIMRKKYKKSMTAEEVAELLEVSCDFVEEIYRLFDAYPDFTDGDIAEEYFRKCNC